MRVMIVEDETEVMQLYVEFLKDFEISGFMSPKDAIAEYSKNPFSYDVVIVDHLLPHKTGEALIFDLKYLNPNQKIIVVSGCPEEVNLPIQFGVEKYQKMAALACGSALLRSALNTF